MATTIISLGIILEIVSFVAIFGFSGWSVFTSYKSIDIIGAGDIAAISKEMARVTKTAIAAIAGITLSLAIYIIGWFIITIALAM